MVLANTVQVPYIPYFAESNSVGIDINLGNGNTVRVQTPPVAPVYNYKFEQNLLPAEYYQIVADTDTTPNFNISDEKAGASYHVTFLFQPNNSPDYKIDKADTSYERDYITSHLTKTGRYGIYPTEFSFHFDVSGFGVNRIGFKFNHSTNIPIGLGFGATTSDNHNYFNCYGYVSPLSRHTTTSGYITLNDYGTPTIGTSEVECHDFNSGKEAPEVTGYHQAHSNEDRDNDGNGRSIRVFAN